jgi:glycosyltransferase involved in cell wall biosynthesis
MGITEHNKNLAIRLALVLPCFNEKESIVYAVSELSTLIKEMADEGLVSRNSYILFVDDGSTDETWATILQLHGNNNGIKGLKLSRNFGHQAALLAGLTSVVNECDAAISLDADLQQETSAIRDFITEFLKGADIVIGVRKDRETDGWFKHKTASGFYWLMKTMGVDIVPNHADYRLMSKRSLEALSLFPEPNIFLRATYQLVGYRVSTVFFDVRERKFGQSKFTLKKMVHLALHGITSFSIVPLRIVTAIGIFLFLCSMIMLLYVFLQVMFVGDTVPGWASTIIPIYFIGGIQLICLGVVSEYIGQIYTTVKNRPRWICEDKLD